MPWDESAISADGELRADIESGRRISNRRRRPPTFKITDLARFFARGRCIEGLGARSKQAVTRPELSARLRRMNAHVEHILDEALGLPADERSALTVALLDSLGGSDDSSITEAWRQEIRSRQAALRAGTVKAVSWAEARARLSAL